MKLQNNYTTPEQSKRLLELGVPADSADCYYMAIGLDAEKYGYSDFPYFMTTNYVDKEHVIAGINIPCWSVGRLMEILRKCIERDDDKEVIFMDLTYKQGPIVNLLMDVFEDMPVMDFSKLED